MITSRETYLTTKLDNILGHSFEQFCQNIADIATFPDMALGQGENPQPLTNLWLYYFILKTRFRGRFTRYDSVNDFYDELVFRMANNDGMITAKLNLTRGLYSEDYEKLLGYVVNYTRKFSGTNAGNNKGYTNTSQYDEEDESSSTVSVEAEFGEDSESTSIEESNGSNGLQLSGKDVNTSAFAQKATSDTITTNKLIEFYGRVLRINNLGFDSFSGIFADMFRSLTPKYYFENDD